MDAISPLRGSVLRAILHLMYDGLDACYAAEDKIAAAGSTEPGKLASIVYGLLLRDVFVSVQQQGAVGGYREDDEGSGAGCEPA